MAGRMICAVLLSCLLLLPTSSAVDQHLIDLADATNKFALNLYSKLTASKDNKNNNLVFSPLGVSSSLAMPIMGVASKEADELRSLLHLDEVDERKVYPTMRTLLDSLTPTEQEAGDGEEEKTPHPLNMGSNVFIDRRYQYKSQFNIDSRLFYQTLPERLHLAGDKADEHINEWALRTSGQNIRGLVNAKMLKDDARSLLTNVVSFKGNWSREFRLQGQKVSFYRTLKDVVKTQLMFQQGTYRAGMLNDLDTHVVEIPYADNKLRMVMLLPMKRAGLEDLERDLTHEHLKDMHTILEDKPVDVFLPPFQIETHVSLTDILESLGVSKIVQPVEGAPSEVEFSRVLHNAHVLVAEHGVEPQKRSTKGMQQTRAIATHPFLFYVQEVESGVLVLMGRVKDPTVGAAKPKKERRRDEL